MDTSWLELLSNLDKMVLGSIVGSVVLAFLLLIVVFSVKIKSQQDRIRLMDQERDRAEQSIRDLETKLEESRRKETDGQRVMEHYEQHQDEQQKQIEKLHSSLEIRREALSKLEKKVSELEREKQEARDAQAKAEADLRAARDEIEAVLKRNEFWVEQLSELRTKHEALKLKLRKQERPPS